KDHSIRVSGDGSSVVTPPHVQAASLRKTLSLQNVAQIEVPWEGVTLNRCLFIAITILVLTSGCQRLNEVVRGRKDGADVDGIGTALNVRHTGMRKGRLPPPEPETSLWETFFWWVSDDDEEVGRRGRTRKATQEKSSRGLRHKATPNRNLLKGRQDRFKARRGKARQDEEELKERVKGQRVKEKRLTQKKLEKKEQGKKKEEEEKMQKKKNAKESKKKDTKV
ncbi:hypothetical protein NFI96_031344, partial [Prochilodus magdalenae]